MRQVIDRDNVVPLATPPHEMHLDIHSRSELHDVALEPALLLIHGIY